MPLAKMNGIYNALNPVFALCTIMRAINRGVSKRIINNAKYLFAS